MDRSTSTGSPRSADVLQHYRRSRFRAARKSRDVFRRGEGPAVIIIHEMPGIHPAVVRFADRVAEAGMTAVLPSLFGTPGRELSAGYVLGELFKAVCIAREFNIWANNRSSPIVDWLRALARSLHEECGGRGVGAVGMCFTGGYALAMMTEPSVVAPVLSQPSCPLAGRGRKGMTDASADEIACARARFAREDLSMIGLRFREDPMVPDERFAFYARTFGSSFEAIELDPDDAAPGWRPAHSVLTTHLKDAPGEPTKLAEEKVIGFLKARTAA